MVDGSSPSSLSSSEFLSDDEFSSDNEYSSDGNSSSDEFSSSDLDSDDPLKPEYRTYDRTEDEEKQNDTVGDERREELTPCLTSASRIGSNDHEYDDGESSIQQAIWRVMMTYPKAP
ncbi:hypothetical protein AVEN_54529-1 [Araneus ventricosus]|uniref:Uncharacterized protein n=1 Tax=Araneus ventricosus TaxID=182803 RepID=A0A4Y2TPW2_ARAVE|nr:hypothetical protein AVEN_54529-1 [Araneus ventricosus]